MGPDGSGRTKLTESKKLKRKGPFRLANNPVFSPSGTQIMYTQFKDRNNALMVMALDGSGKVRVPVSGANFDNKADWGTHP